LDRSSLKEYFDAPETALSFLAETVDVLAIRHVFHENMATDDYHVPIIRNQLTQSIAGIMPDIVDEVEYGFASEVPVTDGMVYLSAKIDWTPAVVWDVSFSVVARIASRVFVGKSVCKDLT
jgi:hypothetical protein